MGRQRTVAPHTDTDTGLAMHGQDEGVDEEGEGGRQAKTAEEIYM